MRMGHLVQADIDLRDRQVRFWMDSCGGRDPVAMAVLEGGWASCEPPLPALIADWSARLAPLFIDIGAGSGFFSLLAGACGARGVHAFEPTPAIRDVLSANAISSELHQTMVVYSIDAAGLASLGGAFPVQAGDGAPVVLRIDAGVSAVAMLRGAGGWLARARPAVVLGMRAEADGPILSAWTTETGYRRFLLDPDRDAWLCEEADARPGLGQHHRVLIPAEAADRWLDRPAAA